MSKQNNNPPYRAPLFKEGNSNVNNAQHSPSNLKGWQPTADGVDAFFINGHKILKRYTANLPRNSKLKDKAKALRKAGVLSEVLFWQQVKQKKFHGIDFDRQRIIGHYIVDFYIKSLSLVIEIDGESHGVKGTYDETRQNYLQRLGLLVYRIEDKQVKQDIGLVMRQLEDFIIQSYANTPPYRAPLFKEGNSNVNNTHHSPSNLKGWQPTADGVDKHA